ncbi:hypothetical protein [Phaeodactylibacter xiamenensis]|uniref:hypothetical protein n=1 Tax=Phaeodactylibacter xiamenensis TaxID=1524460 RepID=UPI0024A8BD11|nr:hypothetical protein [Phaeodactylibacter xiamenensis]
MKILNELRTWYRRAILNEYEPQRHIRPVSPSPVRGKGKRTHPAPEYTVVGTNVYVSDPDLATPVSASAESQVDMKLRLERGTKKELTSFDLEALNSRNLNIAVAIHVKPYWVIGSSRTQAAQILTRKFGENKGYSQSNIGAIYAALSAARKQELSGQSTPDSRTPQPDT